MTYEALKDNLYDFFGDTSRSPGETKSGLLSIIEEAGVLIDSIPDEPDFDD